ncbi:MAG: tRNA threonylcarbamoyladenosine dehydratase [Prevotellaceae bacterium]|nr:tRNA threonylcarbamoyladenosine dehydratase [Prevotellaceae bacterium]
MAEKHIGKAIFQRSELLLGSDLMQKIAQVHVIIFGIGGVGSWCAESLVRSGIHHLTIVDADRICVTNINRQLHATTHTVGEVKVDALKRRLLEINPNAEITAIQEMYDENTHDFFELRKYHYIIDAIDSLAAKTHLIHMATRTDAEFFSSMGSALKIDPTRIRSAEFWKVHGCPLASALRKRLKKGCLPAKKFICVYSDEVFENRGQNPDSDGSMSFNKVATNGSLNHITAIFGFTLAGLVIQDIASKVEIAKNMS